MLTPEQVKKLISAPNIVATIEGNNINSKPLVQSLRESDLMLLGPKATHSPHGVT